MFHKCRLELLQTFQEKDSIYFDLNIIIYAIKSKHEEITLHRFETVKSFNIHHTTKIMISPKISIQQNKKYLFDIIM